MEEGDEEREGKRESIKIDTPYPDQLDIPYLYFIFLFRLIHPIRNKTGC